MNCFSLYRLIFVLYCGTTLIACHNNQRKPVDKPVQWKQVHSWSFNGKMAINDGVNSGSGSILWIANKKSTKARFKAPLGHGSWEITETSNSAKLTSSSNGESIADNATILISDELGWEFPWENLKFWIRGYHTNELLKSHSILPKTINDNGWTITYQKWTDTPLGMLPKKIKATKDNYSVKLIIYKWNIN